MKYVSWKERKKAAAAMRPIYTALNEAAAETALENLRRDFGKKSPGMVATWDRAWDQFVPFLEFDSAIRKVIYTTNAIVILSPGVSWGCDLWRPVVDSFFDGTRVP